jgi:hypothetical protein
LTKPEEKAEPLRGAFQEIAWRIAAIERAGYGALLGSDVWHAGWPYSER